MLNELLIIAQTNFSSNFVIIDSFECYLINLEDFIIKSAINFRVKLGD